MEADDIEVFRQKKLLKFLQNAKGNGTSMISLIIPPKEQLSKTVKMLTDEYGTATNIKSRVNKLSVLSAIVSAQNKLKTYNKNPPNGLAIYTGTIMLDSNKEKKVTYGISPIKPINTSLYMCDSRFHVESLLSQFEDESKYGFVIVDGHGSLFATLQGNTQTIIQSISTDLPKKHGRGGQSSVRFARLRVEKRLAYVKKVAEIMVGFFISGSTQNVEGVIIGGNADIKNELIPHIDSRITVIDVVDTNYGGKNGLNQAIELSSAKLKDLKFSKEKKILQEFLSYVAIGSNKFCYGLQATMGCLDSGAVETLIVWDNIEFEYENEPFIDWIAVNYKKFGCKLVFVSNSTSEGTQFLEGFGGVGGILRYEVDLEYYDEKEISSISLSDDMF